MTTLPESNIGIVGLAIGPGACAFSTLRGDVADIDGAYSGFNVCDYTGDTPGHVGLCRRALADAVGLPLNRIMIPRQTHSSNVTVIDDLPVDLEGVDAMVTAREDVMLCVNTADCLPVVLNDPEASVIGIAHAGRRGLYDGIIAGTVRGMKSLGADPRRMSAAIGPCICGDCYEVDSDLADCFVDRFPSVGNMARPKAREGKALLDLPAVARWQLVEAGISVDNIAMPPGCTKCRPDMFFSARKLGIASGRVLTAVRISKF